MKKLILIIITALSLFASEIYYIENGKNIKLENYNHYMPLDDSIDYYKDSAGVLVGVTNKIIVGTKSGFDINKILLKYNITIVKQLDTKSFIIQTQNKSLTIDTSNAMSKEDGIEFAQPDFIKQRLTR